MQFASTSEDSQHEPKNSLNPSNFPLTSDSRTMHVGATYGEIANRIITVGDHTRAERISHLFDDRENIMIVRSDCGVTSYTGSYRGVPVTVIATGMGVAMMDFIVRESTYHLKGEICIIRLGTSGILKADIPAGNGILTSKARYLRQSYEDNSEEPYLSLIHI